jgi:hypothetical protein
MSNLNIESKKRASKISLRGIDAVRVSILGCITNTCNIAKSGLSADE